MAPSNEHSAGKPLADYSPVLDARVWAAIADFTLASVADTVDVLPYDTADLNSAATRLVSWCWESAGLPLERHIVFHRDTIARFISVGCPELKAASRGNLRSQLLRMSEVLAQPAPRRLEALPPSDPSAPYSADELVSLRSWASGQSTAARRANAGVLLALGAGAGLSASEIGELRVADIQVDELGVLVNVAGSRARSVPVLREWEDALIERAASIDPRKYAFRENHTTFYPNLVSNFVDRGHPTRLRLTTQRLRATWIVYHLEAGTPVVALMEAAGVWSLEAFTRYAPFVTHPEPTVIRSVLSGAGASPSIAVSSIPSHTNESLDPQGRILGRYLGPKVI